MPRFTGSFGCKWPAIRWVLGLGIDEDAPLEVNGSLADQVNAFEKNAIAAALVAHQGNPKATYEALCLSRKTLYEKMHKYGLRREDFTEAYDYPLAV